MKTILKQNKKWPTVALGDICGIKTGSSNSVDAIETGKYPFFDRSMVTKCSDHFALDKEAIIVAGEGQDFAPRYYFGKFNLHQRAYAVFPLSKKISMKYLYFYMQTMNKKYFSSVAVGSTVKSLRLPHFQNFKIPLPPIKEQERIVEMVDPFDDKIAALRRQNAALQKIADAIYTEWRREGKLNEWPTVALGEICDVRIGKTPPRKETKWFDKNKGNWKWISVKDMGHPSLYIEDTAEYLTDSAVKRFNISVISPQTIVLSFKLTVGRVAITSSEMLSNEAIAQLPIKVENVRLKYLYYALKGYNYKQIGTTSSIGKSLNTNLVKSIELPLPPVEEQEKIASLVEAVSANEREIAALEKVRDVLLKQIMKEVVANSKL